MLLKKSRMLDWLCSKLHGKVAARLDGQPTGKGCSQIVGLHCNWHDARHGCITNHVVQIMTTFVAIMDTYVCVYLADL